MHKRLMNTKEDVIHLKGTWCGISREEFTPGRGGGDLLGGGRGMMKGQMTEMAERSVWIECGGRTTWETKLEGSESDSGETDWHAEE